MELLSFRTYKKNKVDFVKINHTTSLHRRAYVDCRLEEFLPIKLKQLLKYENTKNRSFS